MFAGKFKIIRLTEVNSTNMFASALLSCHLVNEPTIIVSDYQSAGKGQGNNTWQSKPGENLLFSIIQFPHNIIAEERFYLSKTACISVREAISIYTNHAIIKWPNDILYGSEKVSGILIENTLEGALIKATVIGIGINVNQTDFDNLPSKATSLKSIRNTDVSIEDVMETFIKKFEYWFGVLESKDFGDIDYEYFRNLYGFQKKVKFRIEGKQIEATFMEVLKDGGIVLKMPDGEKRQFGFREVEFDLA